MPSPRRFPPPWSVEENKPVTLITDTIAVREYSIRS